ncbi:hypothetical protein AK830_g1496 [Neonectria ditissima]|uniref:Uncharacterized protein n=1 Tax=Neonectria ditissima TaxID=78410 RepID=A0A0P7BEN9_9HYPO|nr:hypothetical protein AK830_g1496 [Neonectria ditissima]
MISRAARVSRTCLSCRVSLNQRSAVLGFRALPRRDVLGLGQRRRFASDSNSHVKAKIEGSISDQLTGLDVKKAIGKEHGQLKQTEDIDQDLLDEDDIFDEDDFDEDDTAFYEPDQSISDEIDKFLADVTGIPTQPSHNGGFTPKPRQEHDAPTRSYERRSDSSTYSSAERTPKYHSAFPSDPALDLPELPDFDPIDIQDNVLRHRLLHNQPLGVSALGVPADAIILNNPNKMRFDKKFAREIEEKPLLPTSEVDWRFLNSADRDAEVESREEVWANINELRPDTRTLRTRDFQKLSDALFSGFTTDQLKEYIRDHEMEADIGDTGLGNYPWIVKQMPWAPFSSLPTGKVAYKYSYIQKLIIQKWKIGVQEHVDSMGQAFIWVDPHYFKFLALGKRPFLKGARNDFLDESNNEKISTTSTECRLNITAPKASTYAILERLDQHLKNVQHRMLPISQIAKQIPSPAELQALAEITSTSLRLHKEGKDVTLQVSWFSEGTKAPDTNPPRQRNEDKADTVLRLLTTIPSRGLVEKVECVPPMSPTNGTGGLFVSFNRERRSMAWKDKLRKWLRYVAPVGISSDAPEAPLDLINSASLPEYPMGRVSTNLTTATFGHLLHSEENLSTDKLSRKRRILAPVTPHPASFSALKPEDDKPITELSVIILKFAPDVDRSTSPEKKGPAVRLRIPITAETNTARFEIPKDAVLHCAVPWYVDDIMLPTKSVDVRLINERHLTLNINQPRLQEFLATSRFNLRVGRLQTPKEVTLSIPKTWLSARSRGGRLSEASVDVLYAFRGIEIHQSIEIPWQGHTLRYSLIEAGQHGGKRQEVTLQTGHPGAPAVAFQSEQRASFLRCVEDIAAGKLFSWTEGHKSAKAQQFEDFSYDLPAEKLGEDFVVSEVDPNAEEIPLLKWDADEPAKDKKRKDPLLVKKVVGTRKLKSDGSKPTKKLAKKQDEKPAKKPAKKPDEKLAEEPTEGIAKEPTVELSEEPTKKPAEKATRKYANNPTEELVEEATERLPEQKKPKPEVPMTPKMSEKAFFKQFSNRAGDQLDQFKTPPKSGRRAKKTSRATKNEEPDEDDPFNITARPKRSAAANSSSATTAGSLSARGAASKASPFQSGSQSTDSGSFIVDEWDDDFNDDEIEDNELSTEQIEAELSKLFAMEISSTKKKPTGGSEESGYRTEPADAETIKTFRSSEEKTASPHTASEVSISVEGNPMQNSLPKEEELKLPLAVEDLVQSNAETPTTMGPPPNAAQDLSTGAGRDTRKTSDKDEK